MTEISDEKFENAREPAKKFYESIGSVECPYLKRTVQFNEQGFAHVLSKSWNRGRSRIEQYTRLRLLPKAVEVIKNSHTLQEFEERRMMIRQKINSRWEKRPKIVRYYVFVAMVVAIDVRIKIVVKEIEGGMPFFWSIYPSWKTGLDSNGKKKKIFHSGNLEED
jgi:hypothetical protein